MDLVCDTNAWYDLGEGRRDAATLKAGGHRLLATPVNFIEIASLISDATFAERNRAAQAIVDHADEVLVDPERHLAGLWGVEVAPLSIDWRDAFVALAQATSAGELATGVKDYSERVIRSVDPSVAATLRDTHYLDFVNKINSLIDEYRPGYAAARRNGQIRHMNAATRAQFETALRQPLLPRFISLGTRVRAALHLDGEPPVATDEEIDRASQALVPYLAVYMEYLLGCATRFGAQSNDWGDLECFVYLQGDRRLLTRDARWVELATAANVQAWLLDPDLA